MPGRVNDADQFVLVQASRKIYFIPAHLSFLTSKIKPMNCEVLTLVPKNLSPSLPLANSV